MIAIGAPLLAALALLAAGCGDDETTTVSSTPTAPSGGLSVRVEPPSSAPGATVMASVRNDTGEQFTYGAAYELEREVDGGFEQVDLPSRPVIEIAYVAPPGETGPPVEVELPADLEPGTYRVVLLRDVPEVGDLAGEFEVTDG